MQKELCNMATKRKGEPIRDQDPDYETVSVMTASKRQRLFEKDAKDLTVKKIEGIIKRQFAIEMRHKEKEVEHIDERIHQVRAMLDKLRACVVANYYGNIGLGQTNAKGEKTRSIKTNLNHPAIQQALASNLKTQSPSETPDPASAENVAQNGTPIPPAMAETPGTPSSGPWSSQQSERSSPESEQLSRVELAEVEEEPDLGVGGAKGPRHTGPDTFGVGPALLTPKPLIPQVEPGDGSRFHVKKRIIVGNVSKYIPPENREDSDPSTHKWMVYVRGPPEEPRIDHFVKRIWFFLHPSYRPNDLVEVKEPPFHLTRRGWGEFPIRIQLHFLDPRNKKVDIIHPLKLDRTYTGLQTLGAETIVDVELDRYLFDELGQPLSRPMTPTITKVNYQEGIKPGSPGTSWDEARWRSASPRIKESVGRISTIDRLPEEPGMGPVPAIKRSESAEASPTRVAALKDDSSQKVELQTDQTSSEVRVTAEQGQSFSGIIGPSGIQPSSQGPPVGTASAGQIAMQQRQGGQFVRVMPPLGPITKSAVIAPSSLAGLSQQVPGPSSSPTKVITPTDDRSGSIVGSPSQSQTSSANVSPTQPGVINVADAAFTGKGTLDVRIQEGKVVQEVTSPTQDITQSKTEATTSVAAMAQTIVPLVQEAHIKGTTVLQTTAPSRVQSVQGVLVTTALQKPSQVVDGSVMGASSQTGGIAVQPTSSQLNKPVMSTSLSTTGASIPAVKRIPSSGSITVVATKPGESPKHSPPATASGIPTPPPGTQYYITAKSTDPNLQGKVILIPQQVFQQASSQQAMAGGKPGVGKASSPPGKAGPSKVATASSKSPFLSPSNVLILPAGSIVPPLPPGSIVQIQQVPSPVRSTTASSQPKSQTTSAVSKAVTAPGKGTGPKISGIPSGGVIQIQRTTGTTVAKVSGIQGPSQATGISILPEQKGQLAKTAAGGVVFVQRTPSGGKISSGQTLTRLPLVQGGLALQQKITLAAQLPPGAVPIPQQGPLSLKPGSSVNIIQNPVPKSLQQGQTLVLHAQSSVPKVPGKSLQTVTAIRQPIVPGGQASKFIIQGQGSKVVTPGQLQVRLSGPATSVIPSRPIAATSVSTAGAESKAVVTGQVSGEGKGPDAVGLAAHRSASATSEAGIQETIPSRGSERENVLSSSSGAEDHIKNQTASTEASSQKPVVIKDLMREATSKTVTTTEPTSGASASATAADTQLVHSMQQVKTKAPQTVLVQHPSRIVIKQEPVTSPQDYPPSSTIQRTPVNPTSATTVSDVQIKMEVEEKEAESEVSVMMRELTMSCLEGPVCVYGLQTMEELIAAVVKKTPLINKDRVQSEHPFAATSLQHYHSWSRAKRRAAEWHRSVSVRRIATEAQVKSEKLRFERIWTAKEVMVWCRQRGYTPPEPDTSDNGESWCNVCGDLSKKGRRIQPTTAGHDCSNDWLSSAGLLKPITYTTPDELTRNLQTQQIGIDRVSSDSDSEIDIIGMWNLGNRMRIKREMPEAQDGIRCYLPYSNGAKMIQEVSQEIGVCFKPTQLASDTFAPVAEEVMFSAVSQFLSTLLRKSLAKAYNKRTDNSLPKEILPTHVLQAIESTESCDFLSNKHLGVLAMPTEENQEAST
ncbi:YEATS domain-containing protein 2-like [Patiria miniata]|uniref:YEATS domain-containing protein 2 n=1 Tax=Patiria miniata TaxID=46514 RepID=A0A913ZAS6_PATMI|nr:YEATS domain-containing protein 2-like [Patiria miniata]